ncbi:Transthyretin-like family protein [Ancylostoma caninum]|uniref:Transthyretin-like family protein n=1 Tax=Ancylostoma caninum TaxID=29170 RepID=A0A368FSU0_ANCCA|nr:Transthyretin-like family protein [Ancylostoma caninum]
MISHLQMRAVIFLLLMSSCYGINFKQWVGVKGILRCNGKAAEGIHVKLYDEDSIVDTLMAEDKTDKNGAFKLAGAAMDLTSDIDPILTITHSCILGNQIGNLGNVGI